MRRIFRNAVDTSRHFARRGRCRKWSLISDIPLQRGKRRNVPARDERQCSKMHSGVKRGIRHSWICIGRHMPMTKRFIAGITAAGVLSGSALAADLPSKAPPPLPRRSTTIGRDPMSAPTSAVAWTNGNLNIPGNNFYGGLSEFVAGVRRATISRPATFVRCRGYVRLGDFRSSDATNPDAGSVSQRWIGTPQAALASSQSLACLW